jgi:hypothetical protein
MHLLGDGYAASTSLKTIQDFDGSPRYSGRQVVRRWLVANHSYVELEKGRRCAI